jgi:hypothetical protein
VDVFGYRGKESAAGGQEGFLLSSCWEGADRCFGSAVQDSEEGEQKHACEKEEPHQANLSNYKRIGKRSGEEGALKEELGGIPQTGKTG